MDYTGTNSRVNLTKIPAGRAFSPRCGPASGGVSAGRGAGRWLALLACAWGLGAGALRAQSHGSALAVPPAPTLREQMEEEILRLNEFFDTMLPGTIGRSNVALDFSPKFSDFRDREFIRYPLELRYGVKERWEIFGGVTPFHPNPFNSGFDHRYGFGQARLGFRYNVATLWHFYDHATIGLETRAPLGVPPLDIIDRFAHLRPFIAATRRLPFPATSFYTNFSYDREVNTPGRGRPPAPYDRKQHVIEVIPGVLYKPGEFGYFTQYTFRNYAIQTLGNHLGHEYRLGAIWDVPIARTSHYGLPGKWQVEVAYKFAHEEGYAVHNGLTARVSWRTTLKELLRHPPKTAP